MKRYAVYLDWENLWIAHIVACFPHLHRSNRSVPRPSPTSEEQKLLYELPELLLADVGDTLETTPRFCKAFAVWENLDHGKELVPRLRQNGVNPIQSLGTVFHPSGGHRVIKEASDRALILKVVEDVILRPHAKLDAVVLGTGDFGFVPLIEFLMEHTHLQVYVASFRKSLSRALREMTQTAFGKNHVIVIDESDRFTKFQERCKATPLKIPQVDRSESTALPLKGLETGFSDPKFLEKLVVGLHNAKLPYVTRWLLEEKWFPKWQESESFSASPNQLLDEAIEKDFVISTTGDFDGQTREVIDLNATHSVIAEILKNTAGNEAPPKQ